MYHILLINATLYIKIWAHCHHSYAEFSSARYKSYMYPIGIPGMKEKKGLSVPVFLSTFVITKFCVVLTPAILNFYWGWNVKQSLWFCDVFIFTPLLMNLAGTTNLNSTWIKVLNSITKRVASIFLSGWDFISIFFYNSDKSFSLISFLSVPQLESKNLDEFWISIFGNSAKKWTIWVINSGSWRA